ncbi:MAG: hypothetical protein IBJ14_04970 [Hydrogenophaga sp.]|nr:hypothetical protein [Hydrogenophaga sp.]
MKINIRENFKAVDDALLEARNQVPFALARALTKTGQQVRDAQRSEIERVFDRPTRYTRNAVFLRTATKQRLEAEVWLKDGDRPTHYLLPQIEGGSRPLKRFEQRLVMAGYMTPTERAVPGGGAQLDQHGNMSRGQITKILSQLRTAAVAGDFSNASDSRRSRAKRAKEAYFVSRGPGRWKGIGSWKGGLKSQHLPRGVWVRRSFGPWGTAVKPVLLFVPRATYRPRYHFFELARRVVEQQFEGNFADSWRDAMRSARLAGQGRLFA